MATVKKQHKRKADTICISLVFLLISLFKVIIAKFFKLVVVYNDELLVCG